MQPGYPGQDPYEPPSSPYPNDYDQPSSPQEYSLYPPQPQYSAPPAYQPVPPGFPVGGYTAPPQPRAGGTNIFALLSLIFGILSLPLLFCCYLGIPFAIAAIVLGIIGVVRAPGGLPGGSAGKGMAIGGIACGAGCFVLMLILVVASVSLGNTHY